MWMDKLINIERFIVILYVTVYIYLLYNIIV